jgi:cytoskeletal protein RodZ
MAIQSGVVLVIYGLVNLWLRANAIGIIEEDREKEVRPVRARMVSPALPTNDLSEPSQRVTRPTVRDDSQEADSGATEESHQGPVSRADQPVIHGKVLD